MLPTDEQTPKVTQPGEASLYSIPSLTVVGYVQEAEVKDAFERPAVVSARKPRMRRRREQRLDDLLRHGEQEKLRRDTQPPVGVGGRLGTLRLTTLRTLLERARSRTG
jgi:hypothetical protein